MEKILAAGTLLAAASGCVMIPHPRDVATARGQQTKKPRLALLKAGTTTREELLRMIGPFDTRALENPLLWARWQQVKVQVEWIAAGSMRAAGGSERVWKIVNLFARFDENDRLAAFQVCSEGELIDCLRGVRGQVRDGPASPRSLVIEARHDIRFHHAEGRAIIEDGRLVFEEMKETRHNFTVPLREIVEVTLHHGSSPEFLRLKVRFRKASAPLEKLEVMASPSEAWQLVALTQQPGGIWRAGSGSDPSGSTSK